MKHANLSVTVFIILFLVRTLNCNANNTTGNHSNSLTENDSLCRVYYNLGIDYSDTHADSTEHYANLIKELPREKPFYSFAYHTLMGEAERLKGSLKAAKKNSLEVFVYIEEGDFSSKIDADINTGVIYLYLDDYDSSEFYFNRALHVADSVNDSVRISKSLKNRANIFINTGNKIKALEDINMCLQIDSTLRDKGELLTSYQNLGNVYLYSGDYDQALAAYHVALNMARNENNDIAFYSVQANMAVVYQSIGEWEKSEKLILENIAHYEKVNNSFSMIGQLVNLSTAVEVKGLNHEKDSILNKALLIAESCNAESDRAQILNNLGNSMYGKQEYDTAYAYFSRALEINKKINNRHEEALCLSNTGWALLALNKQTECIDYFKKALELATQIDAKDKKIMALDGLSEANATFGNYREAYQYRNELMALREGVIGEKTRDKIAELETVYETEKKELEIERLTQIEKVNNLKINESELEISRLNWQRTGLGLGTLLILLTSFTGVKWLEQRKKQEKINAITQEREAGFKATVEAIEKERMRIARDLHDSVGQTLSCAKLKLSAASAQNHSQSITITNENPDEILSLINNAYVEVRNIAYQMAPPALIEKGLVTAIDDLLKVAFANTGIDHRFDYYNVSKSFGDLLEVTLFRICQELISNTIKHSKADEVVVQLYRVDHYLHFTFSDNGRWNKQSKFSLGLTGIKNRLEILKGSLTIETDDNTGTTFIARIPLQS